VKWLEVSVAVENEVAEAVAGVLSRDAYHGVVLEAGPDGWSEGPVVVRAYLPVDDELPARRRRIKEALWHLGRIQPVPEPAFRPIAEADWAEAWKERIPILHVGQRIVICPSWREHVARAGELVIQLDPGQAFGTGLHPTTQMCLMALERLLHPGARVLDLGTGSGILAIAAAKLGADRVLAVDHDGVAVEAARANVVVNGVEGCVSVRLGSLSEVSGCYDLVVVNILAAVILELIREGLPARVSPDGILVLAGILVSQEAEVIEALKQGELALEERWQMDDWVCLAATSHAAAAGIACSGRQCGRV